MDIRGLDENDSALAYHLHHSFVELPVPFMRGDIVVDHTDPEPHPFVFDHLKFWDSAEFVAHGGKPLPPEQAEKLDRRVARMDAKHGWDISHMVACGYELGSHYDGGPLNDPCDICFDVFGAGNNYLDLERYNGPLEGELRILQLASMFVKDEIDVGLAMNFARLVDLEARSSRIRHSYDSEYSYTCTLRYLANNPQRPQAGATTNTATTTVERLPRRMTGHHVCQLGLRSCHGHTSDTSGGGRH